MSTDCIREATREVDGEVWKAKYTLAPGYRSKEKCIQGCVLDLDCEAWIYDKIEEKCYHSKHLEKEDTKITSENVSSGLVECSKDIYLFWPIIWILLGIAVIMYVWWTMNSGCKNKRR